MTPHGDSFTSCADTVDKRIPPVGLQDVPKITLAAISIRNTCQMQLTPSS
jgi:hypothetical protein